MKTLNKSVGRVNTLLYTNIIGNLCPNLNQKLQFVEVRNAFCPETEKTNYVILIIIIIVSYTKLCRPNPYQLCIKRFLICKTFLLITLLILVRLT